MHQSITGIRRATLSRRPLYIRPDRGFQIGYIARVRELYRRLIDTFGRGWEQGDVDTIASVFAPDAVFLETPFSPTESGLAAIRGYWSAVPKNHAEVVFRSGEIYEAGPWFATEFRCTYRRRRSGEKVEAKGAIFCQTQDNKITEMRMYWHRTS